VKEKKSENLLRSLPGSEFQTAGARQQWRTSSHCNSCYVCSYTAR